MADNSLVTQQQYNADMKKLYEEYIYPFLNGTSHSGCIPIGSIIPIYSETAPAHFLKCDGTTYNKADYPQLATHLLSLTDTTAYVVSGDDTKFKVPDLRGEFLRGTGTNGHSNQGDGRTVGLHQDATYVDGNYQNVSDKVLRVGATTSWTGGTRNEDKNVTVRGFTQYFSSTAQTINEENYVLQAVRPTNTSVLYCIAYENVYIDSSIGNIPVDISTPSDGQVIVYDATNNKWVNGLENTYVPIYKNFYLSMGSYNTTVGYVAAKLVGIDRKNRKKFINLSIDGNVTVKSTDSTKYDWIDISAIVNNIQNDFEVTTVNSSAIMYNPFRYNEVLTTDEFKGYFNYVLLNNAKTALEIGRMYTTSGSTGSWNISVINTGRFGFDITLIFNY